MKPMLWLTALLLGTVALPVLAASGAEVYVATCLACHQAGIAGAPRIGNAGDWGPRIAAGTDRLYRTALEGSPKGMPPRGGNPALSEAEVRAAVDFMVDAAKAATVVAQAAPAAPAPPPVAPAARAARVAEVNSFNRLLLPPARQNPPPAEDGIHDPAVDGTHALQAPREAFAPLPKATAGNRVDWVRALADGHIRPRHDLTNPAAELLVMDLNIVREVKGTMPHVVFPHKQHTQWLDCSICHPAIFIPQKGANQMSMASILLGEGCGVCHGKVAFPVSDCRKCHSRNGNAVAPAAGSPGPPTAGTTR